MAWGLGFADNLLEDPQEVLHLVNGVWVRVMEDPNCTDVLKV